MKHGNPFGQRGDQLHGYRADDPIWTAALDLQAGPLSPEGDFRVLGGSVTAISLQVAKTPVSGEIRCISTSSPMSRTLRFIACLSWG